MRSSTILLLSLRSLAHETIKNLVLAGVGRLIVMDDGKVTEEDLGTGFLFRENDGAVGKDVRRALFWRYRPLTTFLNAEDRSRPASNQVVEPFGRAYGFLHTITFPPVTNVRHDPC